MDVAGRRVLIVLPSIAALGGAERQALLLAGALVQAGAAVHVWGGQPPGHVAEQARALGAPVRQVELELRVRNWRLWLNLRAFARQVRAGRFDWIVPYTNGPNIFCAMTWRKARARACIWNQRDEGQRLGIKPVDFKAVQRSPVLVSNSIHAGRMLVERLGADPRRIRVVHNGVQLAPPERSPSQWRQELAIVEGVLAAVMPANLTPRKDHATLITAWVGVLRQHPRAVLVLAGEHGEEMEACRALAAQLGVESAIRFPGPVRDIAGLLAAMDFGVFSSRMEGCPNGVLECMAAGLAVAGTDIPGIREAVGQGAAGLAPPGDAPALAAEIAALLADKQLRASEGERNRARSAADFSPSRMVEGMVAALREAEHG